MKSNEIYIEYKGQKYNLVFDINVIETLQTKYGSFNKWSELIQPTKKNVECNIEALKFGFCEAINEGIDIANEDSAIYFAKHGQEVWKFKKVYNNFIEFLEYLAK